MPTEEDTNPLRQAESVTFSGYFSVLFTKLRQ